MKTGLFVGRFQPPHAGHFACIRAVLATHDRVVVMIRDTPADERNPFTVQERWNAIRAEFPNREQVEIKSLADPGCDLTVFIGRDVGYEVIRLDAATEDTRASDIRAALLDAPSWDSSQYSTYGNYHARLRGGELLHKDCNECAAIGA